MTFESFCSAHRRLSFPPLNLSKLRMGGIALVALLPLTACSDAPQPPEMPEGVDFFVKTAPFAGQLQPLGAERFRYRGGVSLQSRYRKFGSYSGLSISPDLSTLTAVGWGNWLSGSLKYDDTGNLSGFSLNSVRALLDELGAEITRLQDNDAEALYAADEYFYVGFEENNRIWRYQAPDVAAEAMSVPSAVLEYTPSWGGFSSVTGTADGNLLALTEGGKDPAGNTKGWLWDGSAGDAGSPISLRAAPNWLPVDLTLLPDGDLLLVEVRLGETERYDHSRFSRIAQNDVVAGSVMQAEPVGLLSPPDFHERTEGIHVAEGPNGETLLYLISDSSHNWPTHILLFEIIS